MTIQKGSSESLFKARLMTCGAAIAMATALISGQALAQTATDDGTTVVVTGIKKGIQDAISVKKKSSQIVEAVSAEDIGKLPDVSIAESIARLPGVAAQRTNGRAQTLSIRGLGPDYTVTTLNGREQVSTNDNRSVEFDQYPSELISAVLVYKTPNASMVTQGIAGTADLQTVRPLNFKDRVTAVNVRKELNSEDAAIGGYKNTGSRYSVTYIDQFMDRKIGVAFGYAHTNSPYQATKDEPWGDGDLASRGGAFIPGGQKNSVQSSTLVRDGYMGVIEFKPNDKLHATVDLYHSDFEETQRIARLEYPLEWGGATLASGTVASDGYYDHGTFTDVKVIVENYANRRKSKIDSVGLNLAYELGDNWTLTADANKQTLNREDVILESTAGTGPNGSGATDTVSFQRGPWNSYALSGAVDYTSFDNIYLTDPKGWGGAPGRAGYLKNPNVKDELSAIKLSATRRMDTPLFSQVSFGFNQTDHTKTKVNNEGAILLPGSVDKILVPVEYRRGTTDASFLGNGKGMIAYDSLAMYDDGFFGFQAFQGNDEVKRNWSVDEKVKTLYVMADIQTQIGSIPVTGNIGIQQVETEQSATSYFTNGTGAGGLKLVTDKASYSDTLPSLSLNFEVAEDMKVRFGAATTTARPRMDDLSAGTSYGVTNNLGNTLFNGQKVWWSGGGGNAKLKPWKANAYDLSVEKYFGKKGYISAAVFYKDLVSYVYDATVYKDYTGAALSSSCFFNSGAKIYYDPANANALIDEGATLPSTAVFLCSNADANRIGITGSKSNVSGGHMSGVELTLSLPGEVLTPMLDGFGLYASGSFNSSSINPSGVSNFAVPGLSKKVINTTVYYEKYGFSARLSNRYRGDFVGEVPNYQNGLDTRNVKSESVVDAQVSYTFQNGPVEGLNITLSGSNLTNEPFFMYKGKNVVREEKYGSTYMLGVSYKFK